MKYGAQERGAVGPASPAGRYAEAPAAALFPLLRVENSRNPALMGGAMLISPMLFFLVDRALLAARRAGTIRPARVTHAVDERRHSTLSEGDGSG